MKTSLAAGSRVVTSVNAKQINLDHNRIFEGDDSWMVMPAPTGTLVDGTGG